MKENKIKDRNGYFEELKDKKVFIAGLGISNLPLVEFFARLGVRRVIVGDSGGRREEDRERVERQCAELMTKGLINGYSVGEGYLGPAKEADVIFKSPGIRFDEPELIEAVKKGAVLTSEMEEFIKLCPCRIYAVTGSDGKTTTTTLIHHFLENELRGTGRRVFLGGNIGTPLFTSVNDVDPCDAAVLELSSFQLLNMRPYIDVSVITNISPNHLDVHRSMDEYVEAKKNIYFYGDGDTVTVLNRDNDVTAAMTEEAPGELRTFSMKTPQANGAFLRGNEIVAARGGEETAVLDRETILIPGDHNVENYMAAICATLGDVSPETVRHIARTFKGVKHRIELIREKDGVRFYNSSIDSSPARTIRTLSVFPGKNIIMVAGGKDKKLPFDDLGGPVCDKVKTLVLTGPTSEKIEAAVRNEMEARAAGGAESGASAVEIIKEESFERAVEIAAGKAATGDIVLLSPACTSYDRFRNFEERGDLFRRIVGELTGEVNEP